MNPWIKDVCKIGQGKECCRYLILGAKGFECGKVNPEEREMLDRRKGRMVAQGDNCEGRILEEQEP